jgi:hypothetical protein
MSMFGNLTENGLEEAKDVIGGGGVKESGIYSGKIKLAYAGKSRGGAQFIAIHVDLDGFEYRETMYITNRNGENFYLNKQDNTKKMPLPGFTTVNDLCLITTGKPLAEQDTEEKVVKLYDFDAKAEVPQNVPVLTDMIGQDITFGLIKQIEDKNVQDASGNYVPSGETRETNTIDKFFDPDSRMTVAEAKAEAETAEFIEKWDAKNTGKTRNRAKGAAGNAGKSGAPGKPAAGGAPAPKKSLFGKG